MPQAEWAEAAGRWLVEGCRGGRGDGGTGSGGQEDRRRSSKGSRRHSEDLGCVHNTLLPPQEGATCPLSISLSHRTPSRDNSLSPSTAVKRAECEGILFAPGGGKRVGESVMDHQAQGGSSDGDALASTRISTGFPGSEPPQSRLGSQRWGCLYLGR